MASRNRPIHPSDQSDHGELRAYYDRQGDDAARSGRGIRCSEETVTRAVIELLYPKLNSFQTVLDIGCGANLDYDLFLAEHGKDVVAVEFSRSFLKLAPRNPRIQLIQGTATALPFAAGEFQAAICSETVEHIPADDAVVDEIARVLCPGGLLVFTVPNLWNLARLIDFVKRRSFEVTMMQGHLREYTRRRALRLLTPHFDVEKIIPVPFGWTGRWGAKFDWLIRVGVLTRASKSIAAVAHRR